MKIISKEYLLLFNALTDAEESLRQLQERLMNIQRQAEELYLAEADVITIAETPAAPPETACCICP